MKPSAYAEGVVPADDALPPNHPFNADGPQAARGLTARYA